MTDKVRVALTLEQCWHRVPGGTGVAAIGTARALGAHPRVEAVGVAARHRGAPPIPWTPPIKVEHLALPRLALYESWHRLRRPSVESATGPVDVIHATSLAVPPCTTKLVVTIHDLAFLHDPTHFTKRGLSFFRRGLQLARDDADVIHCPSRATAEDCVAHEIDRDRIRVVPFAADPVRSIPDAPERVRDRFGLATPFVLWTGTIEPRKNLRRLLVAWRDARTTDATLVLVGPQGWNEDLGALIEDDPTIKALGFVDRAALDELYAAATVFCWPSLREGFGLPVLEAMAHARPVITSRGTSTEEIAGDAAVLVDPTDESQIACALSELLENQQRRDDLGARARDRAAAFSWERTAQGLFEVYASNLGVAA